MRISRIYVDHFGAPTGWYEQTTFDLCDTVTNEPGDACINLENGGGKTSILSYIFSCFDPRLDHWLQFLQKKTHAFKDYFARDGRPSFMIVEAIMPPKTTGGAEYPLIIGQSVVVKESADRASEVERRFFTFEATAGLRWEDLPVPDVSMAPVKTMQEFLGWVQQAYRLSGGDFYITQNQGEWMAHLEERRMIDLELLKMQVEFNRREGGSADGFLSFSTERDLVSKLLNLSMNKDQTAELRNMVGQAVDNLKSKPRLEEKLRQFGNLQQVMVPFSETAVQMVGATAALKNIDQQAVNVTSAMQRKLIETETEVKKNQESIADAEKFADKLLEDGAAAYSDHVAITGLVLKREEEVASKDLSDVAKGIAHDELHLKNLMAALARREIVAITASIHDLEVKKEAATQELKPLEEECARNGSMLRHKLEQEIAKLNESIRQLVLKRDAAWEHVTQIDQAIKELNKTSTALSQEQGTLEGTIFAAQKIFDGLISSQLVLPTDIDGAHSALDRFVVEIEEQEALLKELKAGHSEKTLALNELRQASIQANQTLSGAKNGQEPLKKYLGDHELALEKLQTNQLLIEMVQGVCDPRSLVLVGDVEKLIEQTRAEISKKAIRLDQLEGERESIVQTGLSGRNTDVELVIDALSKAGVRSARAANTYVADLRHDANEARDLVLSDPSRYLGVNVASEEWGKALSLVPALQLELAAPVTLAVASLAPANADAERMVFGPVNDAAFNREAAQVALATFEATIAQVNAERDEFVKRDALAQAVLNQLKLFQANYSHQQVVSAEVELEGLKELTAQAAELIENLSNQITDVDQSIAAITPRIEQLPIKISTLKNGKAQLLNYLDNWLGSALQAESSLKEILAKLSSIADQLHELETTKAEKAVEASKYSTQENSLRPSVVLLRTEHDQVVRHSPDFEITDASQMHSLESLRSRYSQVMALLSTEEKDRLGLIGHLLDAKRQELEKAERNYRQEFQDVDDEVVKSLMPLEVDSEIAGVRNRLAELVKARQEKQELHSDAKSAIKEYWRSREKIEPSDEMLGLADDDLRIAASNRLSFHEDQKAQRETALEQISTQKANNAKLRQALADLRSNLKNLDAAFDRKTLVAQEVVLSDDVGEMVTEIIRKLRVREEEVAKVRAAANKAYQAVIRIVGTSEFRAAEGQIAEMFAAEDLDRACADNEHISAMIADRVSALQGTLDGMVPDFERCVTEIYNQVASATSMLKHAMSITMPIGTPYVSGRSILKMSSNLQGMSTDQRKGEIAQYLNRLIETTLIPETGSEITTQCLLLFTPRETFGLQILKMEENTEFQYQPVNNMKSSGGQGTVMAMFLYMLVSHLRVDTAAKAMRGGGGPLLLDNPFANVQTRALIDAQRMLAESMKIQLICLTANADPNIIEGFHRVLRLRKAGVQKNSHRTLIEMVKATFKDEVAA
jgi:chromosome segregation ATPase